MGFALWNSLARLSRMEGELHVYKLSNVHTKVIVCSVFPIPLERRPTWTSRVSLRSRVTHISSARMQPWPWCKTVSLTLLHIKHWCTSCSRIPMTHSYKNLTPRVRENLMRRGRSKTGRQTFSLVRSQKPRQDRINDNRNHLKVPRDASSGGMYECGAYWLLIVLGLVGFARCFQYDSILGLGIMTACPQACQKINLGLKVTHRGPFTEPFWGCA